MKIRIFIITLILAAQVLGLFFVSLAREREWNNNPTFRLKCVSYDPRDFLRGHYLPLRFKIEGPIAFSKFDAAAQQKLRDELADDIDSLLKPDGDGYHYVYFPENWEFWAILAPNEATGLWEIERVTAEDPKIDFNAHPHSGKIALKVERLNTLRLNKTIAHHHPLVQFAGAQEKSEPAVTAKRPEDFFTAGSPFEIQVPLEFAFANRRFYLSEEKAKRFDREFQNDMDRVSAELFFRADGSVVPKHLLVDGKPF